jgi:hypothetical protein
LVWDKIVDLNESINNCLKSMSNEQETWPELKDDLMISGYRLRNNAGNITPIDTHIVGNNITSKEKLPELKLFTVPPPPQTPLSPSSGSRTNLWRGSQTLENIWGAPIIDQKQSSAYLLPYPTIGQPTRPVDPARGPVRLNQDSNFAINLREIKSSVEMAAAEPGQMVYYTGGQVPKIALTTGTKSWPSVPLNCRMWTPSNNYKKYSILNPKLMNMNESRPQYSQYYYVDDICARENGLMEDFSRNFRMPSRNHGDKKTWSGYNVYDCASFGDSLELAGQLRSIKTESARDLYQFALWFMVVAMAHHQVENE